MKNKDLEILGVRIKRTTYSELLEKVNNSLKEQRQTTFTGANVNIINLTQCNLDLLDLFNKVDIIYPDGIGVYLASKFLFGHKSFPSRITGSDFYKHLIDLSKKNNWSFYFFGDREETANKILQNNPGLNVKGYCNGFNYKNERLIQEINNSKADILIVGLGSPKQEEWIISNKIRVNPRVIIAVGDGIKVFSGTKRRGPKILQKLGLEWAARLVFEPRRLWRRYLIGNPLFVFRILKSKLSKDK
jgi:N-acetylglucosaminyldiphosphoundecaprenol N-acetyl-beta-D-mannosaminyltransferase